VSVVLCFWTNAGQLVNPLLINMDMDMVGLSGYLAAWVSNGVCCAVAKARVPLE
jgi:hypothetical protein